MKVVDKLTEAFNTVETFTKKNSPTILTGLSVVGLISTAVSAFKAGPKAERILKISKEEMSEIKKQKLYKEDEKAAKRQVALETVKQITPVVLPPIIMGSATTACILGSHSISSRRIAAISAAYSISEKSVKELNNKMTEVLGEKKTRSIKDAISKEKVGKAPEENSNQIIVTGDGNVLCKDLYSGRYFYSNAEKIGQAVNRLSYRIIHEMYISLNEFYEEIGIPSIPLGEDLGWNMDDTSEGQLPITYTAVLTDDGRPCLAIEYDAGLRSDYRNLY